MENSYYTVEQVAEMLDMHPKTIQRYIREGKLKANKVGRRWRVTGHDLSIFVEGSNSKLPKKVSLKENELNNNENVKISSVVDINVNNMDEAMRIINMLTAVLNTKPQEYGKSTMAAQYLEPELKVRIMLWGSLKLTKMMIESISDLTNMD